jgi:hypothetical protein
MSISRTKGLTGSAVLRESVRRCGDVSRRGIARCAPSSARDFRATVHVAPSPVFDGARWPWSWSWSWSWSSSSLTATATWTGSPDVDTPGSPHRHQPKLLLHQGNATALGGRARGARPSLARFSVTPRATLTVLDRLATPQLRAVPITRLCRVRASCPPALAARAGESPAGPPASGAWGAWFEHPCSPPRLRRYAVSKHCPDAGQRARSPTTK